MSTVDEQHARTSKKIFSVIATIGGYLKAFVLIYYLYKPFLERKFYIELINHLYNVEADEKFVDTGSKKSRKNKFLGMLLRKKG